MKSKQLLLALCFPLILSACGTEKSSNTSAVSVDNSGNCTSTFVSDYNSIVHETKMTKMDLDSQYSTDSQKRSSLQRLSNACQKFNATHVAISCRAEVNYVSKQVSSGEVQGACNAARDGLSPGTSPQPAAPVPPRIDPITTGDTRADFALRDENNSRLRLRVMDSSKVRQLIVGADAMTMAVDGRVGSFEDFTPSILAGETLCILSPSLLTPATLYRGDEVKIDVVVTDMNADRVHVKLLSNNSALGIGCTKRLGRSLSVSDVRKALRGIFEVRVGY